MHPLADHPLAVRGETADSLVTDTTCDDLGSTDSGTEADLVVVASSSTSTTRT